MISGNGRSDRYIGLERGRGNIGGQGKRTVKKRLRQERTSLVKKKKTTDSLTMEQVWVSRSKRGDKDAGVVVLIPQRQKPSQSGEKKTAEKKKKKEHNTGEEIT